MKKRLLVLIVLFATISGFSQPCQQIGVSLSTSADSYIDDSILFVSVYDYESFNLNATGIYPQNGLYYSQDDSTSVFEWNFGDGNIETGNSVTHSYSVSGLIPVTLTITDVNNCTYSTVIYIHSYPEFSIEYWIPYDLWEPDDTIMVGDTIYFNGYISDEQIMFIDDTVFLPDGTGVSYISSITFDDFAPGATIDSLSNLFSINTNMEHSFLGDLVISMTCPNGTVVILEEQHGGGAYLGEPLEGWDAGPGTGYDYGWALYPTFTKDMGDYVLGDGSMAPLGVVPSGTYMSSQPLTDLIGCPMNGEWKITFTDNWSIDDGYVFSWYINLNYINFIFLPTSFSWSSPAKVDEIYDDPATGNAWVIPSETGWHDYIFSAVTTHGMTYNKTISIFVGDSAVGIETQPIAKTTFNAYPNPFNEKMVLEYNLAKQENVKIEVTNIIGKKVKTLMNGVQLAGSYNYSIDGKELESGIYIVKFTAGSQTFTKKLVRE